MTEAKEQLFIELLTDPQERKIMAIFKSLDDEGQQDALQLINDIVSRKTKA